MPLALLLGMADGSDDRHRVAPIFILADDDREALQRLTRYLPFDWYYIPIWEAFRVVRYAEHFATTAVFLADGIDYPEGGSARLLQQLLDRAGKPVVVLVEMWSPDVRDHWVRMGAADCLPHPSRLDARMEILKTKMHELAFEAVSRIEERPPGGRKAGASE